MCFAKVTILGSVNLLSYENRSVLWPHATIILNTLHEQNGEFLLLELTISIVSTGL
jgi:hypothetical protein